MPALQAAATMPWEGASRMTVTTTSVTLATSPSEAAAAVDILLLRMRALLCSEYSVQLCPGPTIVLIVQL